MKPNFPPRMAGWQYQYERATRLRGLLKRLDGHICHHSDSVSWQDGNYCDCAYPDLLDELAKELEDD